MKSAATVVFLAPVLLYLLPGVALAAYDPGVADPAQESPGLGPRLRIGISGLAGANSFFNGGYDQPGFIFPDRANGAGGFAVALVVGAQWTGRLSTELELEGAAGIGQEGRVSILVTFTAANVFSVGFGPAAGVNLKQECTSNFNFLGPSGSPGPCGDYSAGYLAGEARLDFLPGGTSSEYGPRRSFDIALEATVGATLAQPPQGDQSAGGGFYLLLGYLWY